MNIKEAYAQLGKTAALGDTNRVHITRKQVNMFLMRIALPYGAFIEINSNIVKEVLFNRLYEPILERVNNNITTYTGQHWFYDDGNPPFYSITTMRKLAKMLHAFSTGLPIEKYFIIKK